ncbi:MAG TPA: lamin tail domain-containing protein [Kofleriaceae bacterium]|nr:lamin tail domain-containing protein [Kofleriaceae bacterium]
MPVPGAGASSAASTGHLRLVAGNLTSGNDQAYLSPGIHIFKGVNADVAMIQEFNVGGNSASELRTFVDQAFGTDYAFARGAASDQIPNGIVSRYPIIASGAWTDTQVGNRTFVWAQIDIPGPIDLYAISVHLLSSSSGSRNTEAGELVSHIRGLPANAYVVLGGDFNTGSRTEACVSTLSSVLVTDGAPPVDQAGKNTTNANRNKPYDWVLASGNLDALETAVTIGANTFAHGLVVDTRVYKPLSDLAPMVASDSAAINMQHMAVVRDFALPGVTTPPPTDPPPTDPPPTDPPPTDPPPTGGDGHVAINEILANEPGSDTNAEFVELVNSGGAAVDLSGWTVSDSTAVRHTFAAGTTLGAGRAIVVFGGASAIPAGLGNAVVASTGSLSLGNSGDTVKLGNASGTVDSFTYTAALAGSDGVSMNRSPDGAATGSFVLHSSLTSRSSSPGTRASGAAF